MEYYCKNLGISDAPNMVNIAVCLFVVNGTLHARGGCHGDDQSVSIRRCRRAHPGSNTTII